MGIGVLDAINANDYPDIEWECPRCHALVQQRFYGPCETCMVTLRTTFATAVQDIEKAEYVPKMNVTPNAVALKDD